MVSELEQSTYLLHTMRRAYSIAARRGSAIVGLEHFLYALLDDPEALALMESCGTDIASIRVEIGQAIQKNTPRKILGKNETPDAGKALQHVMHTAGHAAREAGRDEIDGAIVLATLAGQSDNRIALTLNRHGLSFGKALGWIDSQTARKSSLPPPRPPQPAPEAAPQRPPATRQTSRPAPPPPEAPSKTNAKNRGTNEPTLEEMLATIREVMDEEADQPAAKQPPPAQSPRKPVADPRARSADKRPRPAAEPPKTKNQPPPKRRQTRSQPEPRRRSGPAQSKSAKPKNPPPASGKLVERIPRVMREGLREQVEVRIAREATEELLAGMQGNGAAHVHGVAVTRAMSLYLRAPEGGFMIEPLTPETQWVFDRPSFLDSEPFGRWLWAVLPMKRGSRRLQLVAAARSIDENGMIGDVALPEQIIEVSVKINWARSLRKVALWAGLAVAGGVLAQVAIRSVPGLAG